MDILQSLWQRNKETTSLKAARNRKWVRIGMLLPASIILFGVTFYPFIFNLYYSMMNVNIHNYDRPEFSGLTNYARLFGDVNFWSTLNFSVVYLLGCLLLETILGFALALLVNRCVLGRKIWFPLLLTPMMIAPAMVGIMYVGHLDSLTGNLSYYVQAFLGITDPLLTGVLGKIVLILIDTWQWTPFIFLLVYAGLQALSVDVYEAGKIDGANTWQMFWKITFPLVRPALAVAMIFRTLDLIRTFDQLYIIKGGAEGFATLSIYIYQTAFQAGDFGKASAITFILFILLTWSVRILFTILMGGKQSPERKIS
jgi:ABC-type sugar transport system permease subunit